MATLLSRYLKALRVPHTREYADACFDGMPFKTLFGLSRVLEQFGVQSRGLEFGDKQDVMAIPVPFLAQVHGDVVIVTSIKGNAVTYESIHGLKTVSEQDFLDVFSGVVMQSVPDKGAREPQLTAHRFRDVADAVKMPLLVCLLALLAVYGSVKADVWSTVGMSFAFIFNVAGVGVCYLLWLKTNGVKSRIADSMCGLTTKHGCDKVLDTRAASFMGIFKWSEVGMGYFAVSLMAMVMFPSTWPALALFNACCLPYTLWSVTYQRFVIHAWCTLCLTVQTLLWCLFFSYLAAGAWRGLTVGLPVFVLLAAYICGVLLMNLVNMFISKAKALSTQN